MRFAALIVPKFSASVVLKPAFIQQRRHGRQKLMLLCHVAVLKIERVNMSSQCRETLFRLSLRTSIGARVVDERKPPLRSNQFNDLVEVLVRLRRRQHEGRSADPSALYLRRQRPGCDPAHGGCPGPSPRLRVSSRDAVAITTRSVSCPGKLDRHGSDPAGATDDKEGVGCARYLTANIEAIERASPRR